MKCFFPFKDKFKAPELQDQSKSDSSAVKRTSKSLSSLPSPRTIPEMYKEKEQNLRVFTYEELREATNGFHRLLKIGEGGFGSVYKGKIRPPDGQGDPTVVAIKKLNTEGMQVLVSLSLQCNCISLWL